MNLFQKLFFLLYQKENKELTESELSEEDALSVIKNSGCVFLQQVPRHLNLAYNAHYSGERNRNILLAHSKVKVSREVYQSCGKVFPYNKAITILFNGFKKRELIRQDLETAFRQAVSDGEANPLI